MTAFHVEFRFCQCSNSAVMNVLEHKKTHIQRLMTSSFVFILNYSVLNFCNTWKVKALNEPTKYETND